MFANGVVSFRLLAVVPVYFPKLFQSCRKLLKNVPYIHTFGTPDQGQTLDVQESQTAESALRDDWTWNVPHHTLEVVLEVTLGHMCTGLRP